MARFSHAELAHHIQTLTIRYSACEFPFSDDVMRASLYCIGLRGDELREAMTDAVKHKAAANGKRSIPTCIGSIRQPRSLPASRSITDPSQSLNED